ncbi:peptidyl-prolyl cis-trans isomerase [Microbulbifer epialgicus]|uniref:peptidylprolyl isomerase n=1 Tax=Microbulbifer epialgicus TaxID=393907 RepID=A0ABV4NX99_9GAMM
MAIALFLFVGVELVEPDAGASDQKNILHLNEDLLVEYIQYRKKTFNPDFAKTYWKGLAPSERSDLIHDYVREEVLYREAINLGLQDNDQIIRRRLIQKLEYVTEGFASDINVSQQDLEDYFRLHQEEYQIEASVTFTHVFFDFSSQLNSSLEETALQTLGYLLEKSVAFEKASEHGDRFIYHRNYVGRTRQLVASHMGADMAQKIFQLPMNTWSGPFESPYGLHLVLVVENNPSRLPNYQEVAPLVLEDYRRQKLDDMRHRKIQELIAQYRIELDPSMQNVPADFAYVK